MQHGSQTSQRTLLDLSQRYGFSVDAVTSMLQSVAAGHGRMAQFDHREFGGSGQWMRGGMTMVSEMFDAALKARVNDLCGELARLLASDPTVSGPDWWPSDLGRPDSTGVQNDVRYAYFAAARRLVIDAGENVTVYDSGEHRIQSFAQQQSSGGSLTFANQHGVVDVAALTVISGDCINTPEAQTIPERGPAHDVVATLEKLAGLHAQGILSDAEFNAKKTELLQRL